jgi:hypothetical protein
LGNHQTGLNRLSKSDFIRENATAFAETSKCKDYSVNLVRVGIDARLTQRCGIPLPVVRTTDPNEVLGENSLVEGMHIVSCLSRKSIDLRPFGDHLEMLLTTCHAHPLH